MLKINDLYVTQVGGQDSNEASAPDAPRHYIMVIDRSGSMFWSISRVIDHLADVVRRLVRPTDWLSIGWFSGERYYGWIVKGHRGPLDSGALRRYASTVNTTCFSEILAEGADFILRDAPAIMGADVSHNLLLFTDGYPVVNDINREVEWLLRALTSMRPSLAVSRFIGYGDGYNRDLMLKMANAAGGAVIHNSELGQFVPTAQEYIASARNTSALYSVQLNGLEGFVAAFEISGGAVVEVVPDESLQFIAGGNLYVMTTHPINDEKCTEVKRESMHRLSPDAIAKVYGAATVLAQRGLTAQAAELLSAIGEAALGSAVLNGYNNDDAGKAIARVVAAATDQTSRWLNGLDYSQADPDQYCAVELLSDLDAAGVEFYPFHKDSEYKRTTYSGKRVDTGCNFVPYHGGTRLAIAFDSGKLNVNVSGSFTGTLFIPQEKANEYGLPTVIETKRYQTFTIVNGGNVNVKRMVVDLRGASAELVNQLQVVIAGSTEDGLTVLDLTAIPVINRNIAEAATFAPFEDVATAYMRVQELKAERKVVRALLEKYFPGATAAKVAGLQEQFGVAGAEYLKSVGLTDNGYSPVYEADEKEEAARDYTDVNSLEFKAKGLSSPPSLQETLDFIGGKGKATPGRIIMAEAYKAVQPLLNQAPDALRESLEGRDDDLKGEIWRIMRGLNNVRISAALGGAWWVGQSREAAKAVVNGVEVSLVRGTERVRVA